MRVPDTVEAGLDGLVVKAFVSRVESLPGLVVKAFVSRVESLPGLVVKVVCLQSGVTPWTCG